jgi:fluoride ion exporter CrcB/FEX
MEYRQSMLLQVLSVVGALMVLIAYAMIQNGVWRELDAGYLALNILGSLMLGVVAIADQRVGFILLEFAWAALGFVGVARAIKARKSTEVVS